MSRTAPIPRHWRKVTYTIVAEDLEPDSKAGSRQRNVSSALKREAVRKWLESALSPHLELNDEGLEGLRPAEIRKLKRVLHDTVESVVRKRGMVERIWQLKKVQGR